MCASHNYEVVEMRVVKVGEYVLQTLRCTNCGREITKLKSLYILVQEGMGALNRR